MSEGLLAQFSLAEEQNDRVLGRTRIDDDEEAEASE